MGLMKRNTDIERERSERKEFVTLVERMEGKRVEKRKRKRICQICQTELRSERLE